MAYTTGEILNKIGLSSGRPLDKAEPLVLSVPAVDSRSQMLVSLKSVSDFDDQGRISNTRIDYTRHLPYGDSKTQTLFSVKFSPDEKNKNKVEPSEIWVPPKPVHQKPDFTDADRNRILGVIARINTHLRKKGPVEDLAKIMEDARVSDVTGEDFIVRGLDREGGFAQSAVLSHYFGAAAGEKAPENFKFKDLDRDTLKTILGFQRNSLEPDKDFFDSRKTYSVDPQSGVEYEASVTVKDTPRTFSMNIKLIPNDIPEGIAAQAIPDIVSMKFKSKGGGYYLDKASFMGETIQPNDSKKLLPVLGFTQKCNSDFARWEYPDFMSHIVDFDMADQIDPFPVPPSLEEEGGEFVYGSLHGAGHEKMVENFGDQIGTGAYFAHRGLTEDGEISTVGVLVDFPFASGGVDSSYDGAIPDYMQFWDHVDACFISHDHFDHCDGMAYYARKGLMKDKTVYATEKVKYILKQKMDNLSVPSELRPKVVSLTEEGAVPISDKDGNTRLWVQYYPNATLHSALCTPFLVTGCYNDDHYNGSTMVYGDGRGLNENARSFFEEGPRRLPRFAGKHGLTVTPDKVDRDITTVLHDTTGVFYDGHSPTPEEVEDVQTTIARDWFGDKGIIFSPISTNNAEYTVGLNVASASGRHVTAVGSNAELRQSCLNLYGVLPDKDLREVRIHPAEELDKPEEERLLPAEVLTAYANFVKSYGEENDGLDEEDPDFDKEEWQKKFNKAREAWGTEELEKLPAQDRDHHTNVRAYMLTSLKQHGAVLFENDINGYLMWKAVTDGKSYASMRATRKSKLAKGFRENPEDLMIFITGTQGNSEERFSTLQKFRDYFSLLDANESVRKTGYKIDAEDYIVMITQPAIPGNENFQDQMIQDLARARDMTVVCAHMKGFKIYNPKNYRDKIVSDLNKKGWSYTQDADGGIRVLGKPIHIHGHGFNSDLLDIANTVKAELHECHHIPNQDAYDIFRNMTERANLNHSGIQPDDFQFYRVDAHAKNKEDKYKVIARTNPSYILVRLIRKFGKWFKGDLELTQATAMRREGQKRKDGLMARSQDGLYTALSAQIDWDKVTNPENRKEFSQRYRRLGPNAVNKDLDKPRRPRSRPRFSNSPSDSKAA